MNIHRAFLLLPLLIGISLPAHGASLDEQITVFQKAVDAAMKRTPESSPMQSVSVLTNVRQYLARGGYIEAEQLVENLRSGLAQEPEATAALDKLVAAIRAERTARQAATEAALEEIVTDVRQKVASRAPVTDFDGPLERLARLGGGFGRGYEDASATANKLQLVRTFVTRWQDYLTQSKQGTPEQVTNVLNEIANLASSLPIVPRSEILALQSEAQARAAASRDSRLATYRTQFEQVIKTLADTIDRAKTAADLDAVLTAIAQAHPASEADRYTPAVTEFNNRCETARRFVQRWQDYLSQLESGNTNAATNTLNGIASDNNFESLYPRSRILTRINGRAAPVAASPAGKAEPAIEPEAVTLENLDKFVAQLRAARDPNTDGTREAGLQQFDALRAAYAQLQLGNPQPAITATRTTYSGMQSGSLLLVSEKLKQQLLLRALPLVLQLPADLKPADQEAPLAYLQRVMKSAREQQNWELAYRVLQYEQTSGNPLLSGGTEVNADMMGYRYFFTGLNQERAGQFTAAVRSYFSSLRNAGPNLPAEEIGRRLNALKAAHAPDYATAETTPDPMEVAQRFYPGLDPRLLGRPVTGAMLPAPPSGSSPEKPAATEPTPSVKPNVPTPTTARPQ